ncbi:DUF2493 domain-containing protein [Hyphomicrobium sp.]|jgi:hypothetical protein|uniref:DUF2493 domain-containing protein n=1 Tax=Hyphomicrobium sp. TaxID=82 RepID=UPI00356A7D82
MSIVPKISRTRSNTAVVIEQLELYGYHPGQDEPDPRPLPETETLDTLIAGLFDSLAEPLSDTRLEPDLPDLLWSLTDLFHRKAARVQRQLDANETRQKDCQAEQDGSEVRSTDLERLISEGHTLIERRNVYEFLRDRAGEHFESHTGSAWRPRTGSLVNHRNLTAAMIDSRDFIAAKRSAERDVLIPTGTKILFAAGVECNDHQAIWGILDKALAKHPDMVLVHGGTPRGGERIAACWADNRNVTQIAFKPDWTRDGKAAPFIRNDRMLELVPKAAIVFPGSGITNNLADKTKKFGIRLVDCRKPPAG